VSPDGKVNRRLSTSNSDLFGFSRDGSVLYVLRRSTKAWELAAIDIRTATERKVSTLSLPATADLAGFSLNPNGLSFATAEGSLKSDIWLVTDFQQPIPRWRALGRAR
jgi:hypothetical protein